MNAQSTPVSRKGGPARRWLKVVAASIGAGGLVLAALVVNVVWFKPFSFRLFCERVFIRVALQSPEMMTQLGLADSLGIDYFNSRLTDRSEAHVRHLLAQGHEDLDTLRRYDRAKLTASERLSADILGWFLETAVNGGDRFFYHPYAIEQMDGIQVALPNFMVNVHPLRTRRNCEDYVARLAAFGRAFDDTIAFGRAQTGRGIVPPRFVIAKALDQLRDFTAREPKQCALYTVFAEKTAGVKDLETADREALLAQALTQVEQTVYPAFRRLTAHMETIEARATDDAGVWKLPNGEAYYAFCLREHTTTDLTPAQVHQMGLAEVERITHEMRGGLEKQGLHGKSVAELMHNLAKDRRFLYANDDAGRKEAIAHLQQMLDEANAGMSNYFRHRPKAGMLVKRFEPFREQAAAMGEYMEGSLDGKRPGIFFANLRNMDEFPRFFMRTLAYHEGIPGHHFQISLAAELKGVPTFRRVIPFSAYVEGWALYAERLMWEVGFHQDPFDNLGRLQDELFRAARLVVDTGIHYKRWPRQQAIDYLQQTTGMAETDVANEIDRYIVWPGQACAYKTGMLKILELREKAKNALGAKFSLKDFHDVVLLNGAMPLGVLQQEVERYVARVSAAP